MSVQKLNRSTPKKIVLSASRRTDIPAFYMPWFMAAVGRGRFTVTNPYNRRMSHVTATPDRVHAIVFWSKNFGPLLEAGRADELVRRGYHLFFNFTINPADRILEPAVPALGERLGQMRHLTRRFGSSAVAWRLDPICFYRGPGGKKRDNLRGLARLADAAAACGVRRCTTSFLDIYAKVKRRAAAGGRITFIDPPLAAKVELLLKLEETLADRGIRLQTCCEKEVIAALPGGSAVRSGACISNDLLMSLYGGDLPTRRDTGQRTGAGCGCQASVDIGDYAAQPCYHNCLFCYANPRAAE